jgi:predicted transposase/invertase (TIGR01784 family)
MLAKATKAGRGFAGKIDYLYEGKLESRGEVNKKATVITHSENLIIPRSTDDIHGNESDTTFLKKSLQALIGSSVPIKSVEFVKNDISAITIDSRSGIYDVACIDEKDNHFIVEMQLSEYTEFIQRMKFYALHRFNTLVKKGDYKFENLPKIYCIGILAKDIFTQIADYHNIAVLRNAKNETIDD